MSVYDRVLIDLGDNESYCCADGCGEIQPIEYQFVYHETRDAVSDELILRKSYRDYQCPGCGCAVVVWDDVIDEIVLDPATQSSKLN